MKSEDKQANTPAQLSELLQRRQARRRRLAALSFEEKIEIIERLRDLQDNRRRLQESLTARTNDEGGERENSS